MLKKSLIFTKKIQIKLTYREQIIFFSAHCVGGATAYLAEISIFQDHHAPT